MSGAGPARAGEPLDLRASVARIVAEVRAEGDAAVRRWADRLDGLGEAPFELSEEERARGEREAPPEAVAALELAASRIEAAARAQRRALRDAAWADGAGNLCRFRWLPVERVGLYVPGGRASYPSTVLMAAIPARVAGVGSCFLTTPVRGGGLPDPLVLVAARLAGVERVFRLGGAQAVAALALGTESVPRVDLLVGPGNAWVTEAKRQLYGEVGLDGLAGPSEVLVLLAGPEQAELAALELLAQAEHDPAARVFALATGARAGEAAAAVARALAGRLPSVPRREVVAAALRGSAAELPRLLGGDGASGPGRAPGGGPDWPVAALPAEEEALGAVARIAPEHLVLLAEEGLAQAWAERVRAAGAVFVGPWAPVAAGDYSAGTDHILPTGGTARWASGLGVHTFLRLRQEFAGSPQGLPAWAGAAVRLARAEGLENHARSVEVRLERLAGGGPAGGGARSGDDGRGAA
ncbi:MAG: histidinol dehydrogenase [Bacillota bacterium]|nr:histidinol dehydrogenase [Bacillota bacterium]